MQFAATARLTRGHHTALGYISEFPLESTFLPSPLSQLYSALAWNLVLARKTTTLYGHAYA
jgi:hypothetical protein